VTERVLHAPETPCCERSEFVSSLRLERRATTDLARIGSHFRRRLHGSRGVHWCGRATTTSFGGGRAFVAAGHARERHGRKQEMSHDPGTAARRKGFNAEPSATNQRNFDKIQARLFGPRSRVVRQAPSARWQVKRPTRQALDASGGKNTENHRFQPTHGP